MDSTETTDQFTIVNRSTEHLISKKLIRKVPYFDKMLSHDLLESKENKVKLDFDEQALKLILNWLEFGLIFIEMDNVINLCTIADYFGVNNYLIDDCISHFHDNFSIEHLPVVIPQVTPTSKLINSRALNVFICRYFTKIVNTTAWLDYPIETIEFVCALDLMIYSEVQVFDAIIRWVKLKKNPRKSYLKRLLNLIRWCHLGCKDLAEMKKNKYVKSLKFEPKLCSRDKSGCDCSIDRTKQNFFIIIDQLDAANLRVKVLNRYFLLLVNKMVEPDDSMPLHLVHNEHVSDIFDSGRNIIRIDWKQKKYRLLDYKSHYRKIHKCLFGDQKSGAHSEILLPVEKSCYEDCWTVNSLLEANDKFILVRSHADCFQCWTTPTTEQIDSHFIDCGHTSLATVLNNNIYLLKHNFEFYQINVDSKFKFGWMTVDRLKDFNFGNLLLTSSQANDDKVFIIEKSTRTLFCYNVKTEKWSSIGRISNCDNRSADGQRESDRLLTFTSTFISMDTIASELG